MSILRAVLAPLVSGTTWRRWSYLILGGAAVVPYVLGTSTLLTALPGLPPWTPVEAVGAAAVLLVGGAVVGLTALIPAVRTLEITAARELLGAEAGTLTVATPARSWSDRRRTALYYGVHLLLGALVSGLSLGLPPGGLVLLAAPFTETQFGQAHGWRGAWMPALGVLLVVLPVYLAALTGRGLAYLAPRLLGPSAADRLADLRRHADQLAERNRLARELHDSVGHALSVVTVQAGAARTVLDSDPEFARHALRAIEESARAALSDLDHALGVLREESAGTRPTPTLADLDRLVTGTGAEVRQEVTGELAAVPGSTSREAYRIVQEGLTNALRHAGQVPVTLRLVVGDGWLAMTMTNPLGDADPTAGSVAGGGRGLAGIRERVTMLRGEMTAGQAAGQWLLTVRLPLPGDLGVIRVLVVDDEDLVRGGIRAILNAEPDLTVVGEAADGAEVPALVRSLAPDVVLMDVRMPAIDGIQATRTVLALPDPPKVLVVTTFANDEYVYDALRAGAAGFLLKRARPEEMTQAVRTVAHGDSLLFPAAIRSLVATHGRQAGRLAGLDRLTEREAAVLRLMTTGRSNAEIAAELVVSAETVKTHVGNVLSKLGARDRTQAVIAAYESGFVTPG